MNERIAELRELVEQLEEWLADESANGTPYAEWVESVRMVIDEIEQAKA